MIKGIIFDVDGVIIDNEKHYFEAYKIIFEKRGYQLSFENYQKYFSGKSIKGAILSFLERNPFFLKTETREQFLSQIRKEIYDYTTQFFGNNLVFYQDTLDFINKVKLGGINLKTIGDIIKNPIMAVTTGLSRGAVLEILSYHKLEDDFKIIVSVEDYDKSKPDPECYLKTLEKMKFNAPEVIGIEDSPAGIRALNGAGIFSVGITNTHTKKDLKEASIIVNSLIQFIY